MKNKTKYIISICLFFVSLILFATSVILFDYNHDWWWTILLSSIVLVITFTLTILIYMRHVEFVCPNCNTQFKPTKTQIIMGIHTATKRRLTCPHCNKKYWCKDKFVEK